MCLKYNVYLYKYFVKRQKEILKQMLCILDEMDFLFKSIKEEKSS